MNKNQILSLIKKNISEIDSSAEVILYGSRARGDIHNESDWDLLVLTNYPVNLEKEMEFRHHIYKLELEIEQPISTFVYSKNEWKSKMTATPLYKNVEKEGIIL
jgi:predicted nucleotidyltransferase